MAMVSREDKPEIINRESIILNRGDGSLGSLMR
jgi:hypothetical protein